MFRTRPFRHTFANEDAPPLTCEGRIQDSSLNIQIGLSTVTIPTVEVGTDESGEFAVIRDWESQLESGFIVRVEPELDESDPEEPKFGCMIRFTRPASLTPQAQAWVDRQWMTLDVLNMIIPPDSDFGISFSHRGHFNGVVLPRFDAHPDKLAVLSAGGVWWARSDGGSRVSTRSKPFGWRFP